MRIIKDNALAILRAPRQTFKEMQSSEIDVYRPIMVLLITSFFSFLFGALNPHFLNDPKYLDIWGDILYLAYRDTSLNALMDMIITRDFFISEIAHELLAYANVPLALALGGMAVIEVIRVFVTPNLVLVFLFLLVGILALVLSYKGIHKIFN